MLGTKEINCEKEKKSNTTIILRGFLVWWVFIFFYIHIYYLAVKNMNIKGWDDF